MWKDEKLTSLLKIAREAGAEILSIYSRVDDCKVAYKDDNSPITEADRRANSLITRALSQLSYGLPILSEESEKIPFCERQAWRDYWLVDPLDGTREFIKRNGEFTVNVGLIRNGLPEVGVVHVPVSGVTYLGKRGAGAWRVESDDSVKEIKASRLNPSYERVRIAASRSHKNDSLENLIQNISVKFQDTEVVSMGSSLKICLLAEGEADLYPRLSPTSEWDTGAAHAVLLASEGEIFDKTFQPLKYNKKEELLNPHFYAVADKNFNWEELLRS